MEHDDFDMMQEERLWPTVEESEDVCEDYPELDDYMDWDAESALASAG